MNDLVRKKNKPLPDEAVIFRALRPRWYDPKTGRPLAVAFFLRRAELGVSVSESAENAVRALENVDRAARLGVRQIRSAKKETGHLFGFDVISDPIDVDRLHSLITGLPDYENPEAQEAADALCDVCDRIIIVGAEATPREYHS